MKHLRIHAGYSRPDWRLRRGFAPDARIPRNVPLDGPERHEIIIVADLIQQLEAMFKRWPVELRRAG